METLAELRAELLPILSAQSVKRGTFTLSSGATSDLYVDAKQTTLDSRGALLVGKVGWQLLKATAEELGVKVDAVGGLTMGADPISLSSGIASQLDDPDHTLQTFTVRKEPKAHGLTRLIEGRFAKGNNVVVVDDVITTGASTLKAIDSIEEAGGKVAFVLVFVDRQESNGRQNIEARRLRGRLHLHPRRSAQRPRTTPPSGVRLRRCGAAAGRWVRTRWNGSGGTSTTSRRTGRRRCGLVDTPFRNLALFRARGG